MRTAIVGGGAAGFFLAINLKEMLPAMDVTILERSQRVLAKVEVSGGGRCNCTNTFADITDGARGAAGNILEGNYLIASNKIQRCGGNCLLYANRAYIKMDEVAVAGSPQAPAPVPGRRRMMVGQEGSHEVPTSFMETDYNAQHVMYDVLGRPVTQPSAHGIYIINGQKILR